MRINLEWLADFVELGSVAEICERLSASGIEIEDANEPVLTLGITPNRADLLSHIGVAREVAAFSGKRLKPAKWRLTEKGPDVTSLIRVMIDDMVGTKRYVARVVRHIKPGPSPAWLQDRLKAIGLHPVNNIVDVTNYVMFEMGQPLHVFDLAQIHVDAGLPTLHIRRGLPEETMQTLHQALGSQPYALSADDIVIADSQGPLALAGLVGGLTAQVTDHTVAVVIESAFFDATRVRQMGRRHRLHTEASHRFERGIDPGMVMRAADRCAQLLADIAEGEVAKGAFEWSQKLDTNREIVLRLERVVRILGFSIPPETIVQLLEPLDIRCSTRTEGALIFQIPSFRFDIAREIDVIEELARRYGYDRIQETYPNTTDIVHAASATTAITIRDIANTARATLRATGCSEVVNYGFGSPSVYAPGVMVDDIADNTPLKLLNPLGEEMSVLRNTLLPGVLQVVGHNQRHGLKHIRLFEIGTTFCRKPADALLPHEEICCAIVLTGARDQGRWYGHLAPIDFSDLSGVIEQLFGSLPMSQKIRFQPAPAVFLNPYCAAHLYVGEHMVGRAGMLLPARAALWNLAGSVFVAEISLTALLQHHMGVARFKALPKFPSIKRDVALIVPKDIHAETIRTYLLQHAAGSDLVKKVTLFDVYSGKPIPSTHVSLAFNIEYSNPRCTLTDAEVNDKFTAVIQAVQQQFGAVLRS